MTSEDLAGLFQDCAPTLFANRHLGTIGDERDDMLATLGCRSLKELADQIIPSAIWRERAMKLPASCDEMTALAELRAIAEQNQIATSLIGQGFHDCHVPPVILRNLLENPGWYTQYTPYQAEIAQGRLEALLNFQTLVAELTGLPFANASLLDEATACAEAMGMAFAHGRQRKTIVVADTSLHPQNLAVLQTRASAIGIELRIQDIFSDELPDNPAAVLVQVPDTRGRLREGLDALGDRVHQAGALLVAVVDPLAQTLLRPPAEWGADIAVGTMQRFGVPMGFGGPHAGFMAVSDALKRKMPGRIVGVSVDRHGDPAYRLALQTREQHIRREKATSNICTAQVLPAILSATYAIWHGPEGLRTIATRVNKLASFFAAAAGDAGRLAHEGARFDTIVLQADVDEQVELLKLAATEGFNLRAFPSGELGVTFDETTTLDQVCNLMILLEFRLPSADALDCLTGSWLRDDAFLTQNVFSAYHSEHELLRYLNRLQSRDLSLTHSMIPLGSCTMKLNAAAEMIPVTWPEFANMHPAAPSTQTKGYQKLCADLEAWLSQTTGLPVCSLQPNAGSQGELAGLLAIRAWHEANGNPGRNICLIPQSAHGTNPASAVMAGFNVVAVQCDERGNVDLCDLKKKAEQYRDSLGALMVTYPSTHGVFEASIREICEAVHQAGGQVYMDGANMNAQVGLTSPGAIGADVCHLNLHKTFCIPHGGGGPGMGPICAARHLAPHMPTHPYEMVDNPMAISSAPFGSGCILVISWMYIRMMGESGLRTATQTALLNANYMAKRLEDAYPVLYTGQNGRVAHEFILDLRDLCKEAGLIIDDVAKRLVDYGFHAPTMSFPVPGTLMVEPTESESRSELDRFCEALLAIRGEIQEILDGKIAADQSALHFAPHTALEIAGDVWPHAYSRETAAYPLPWVRERKFWPAVARIDNTHGDRNLICTCEWPES